MYSGDIKMARDLFRSSGYKLGVERKFQHTMTGGHREPGMVFREFISPREPKQFNGLVAMEFLKAIPMARRVMSPNGDTVSYLSQTKMKQSIIRLEGGLMMIVIKLVRRSKWIRNLVLNLEQQDFMNTLSKK